MSTKQGVLRHGSFPHQIRKAILEDKAATVATITVKFEVYSDSKVDVVLSICGNDSFFPFESKHEANAFVKRLKIAKRRCP